MIYVTAYLAIGALSATLVYFAIDSMIGRRGDNPETDANLTAIEKDVRLIPGRMAGGLVLTALLWPVLLFFFVRGGRRG